MDGEFSSVQEDQGTRAISPISKITFLTVLHIIKIKLFFFFFMLNSYHMIVTRNNKDTQVHPS